MASMLYQAAGQNATRVSFQLRVSDTPATASAAFETEGEMQSMARFSFGTIDRGVIKGVEGRVNE
jgi:hypothetical protein